MLTCAMPAKTGSGVDFWESCCNPGDRIRAPRIAGMPLLKIGRVLLQALLKEIPKQPPIGLVALENGDPGPPFPLSEEELRGTMGFGLGHFIELACRVW